jgi:hypothetical protein
VLKQWFYAVNNERLGPVDEGQLRQLVAEGVVTPDSLVWTAGMAQWTPAKAIPGLYTAPGMPPPVPPAMGADNVVKTFIPYRNVPALVGYYCGVFALIPCFPIGLAGLVLGIIGLIKANREPEIRGKVHAWVGIIAGGLFGLLWLIVTILSFVSAFESSSRGRGW